MKLRIFATLAGPVMVCGPLAHASFHQVEIEQIVGGINGDSKALAIQLRLRGSNQNQFMTTPVQLRLWNADGSASVILGTLSTTLGASTNNTRILVTTPAFDAAMASVSGYASDYTIGASFPIAFNYLSGGKITFEQASNSVVYWSLAFGSYTGANSGNSTNGTFGSPFASALPTDGRGLLYQSGTTASSNNATQYALTTNRASVTNFSGSPFAVVPEPNTMALLAVSAAGLGGLIYSRRRGSGR